MDKSKSLVERFLAIYDDLLAESESIKEAEQIRNKHHDEKGIAADSRGTALLLAVTLATITISLLFQYFLR